MKLLYKPHSNQLVQEDGTHVADNVQVEMAQKLAKAMDGFRWRDPKADPPPQLKVVVGDYGQHYRLVAVQEWGWQDCAGGGKTGEPVAWCDLP